MSDESQFFPLSSTGERSQRLPIQTSWGDLPVNLEQVKFVRSWLVYDSEMQSNLVSGRAIRHTAIGLALAIALSASFWTGIGVVVVRFWK